MLHLATTAYNGSFEASVRDYDRAGYTREDKDMIETVRSYWIEAALLSATLLFLPSSSAQIRSVPQECACSLPAAIYAAFDAPGALSTYAQSINRSGAVSGDYVDASSVSHGFVRDSSGTLTSFDVPGGLAGPHQGTTVVSMNNRGRITGWYIDPSGSTYGFVRTEDGTVTTFSGPGASPIYPASINESGAIAGTYTDSITREVHGFVRAADETITVFDPTELTTATYATSINDDGAITGNYNESTGLYYGFVRAPGGAIATFGATDDLSIFPESINAAGTITGFYDGANATLGGFERVSTGALSLIDAPRAGAGEGQGTVPVGINNKGKVAGSYVDAAGVSHGFLRLQSELIRSFDVPGAGTGIGDGTYPRSVNISGAVAGWYSDASGIVHGFIRSPSGAGGGSFRWSPSRSRCLLTGAP